MRKTLAVVFVLAAFGPTAGTAIAATDGPGIPKNCHEWNELLHIDNVRSCDDS